MGQGRCDVDDLCDRVWRRRKRVVKKNTLKLIKEMLINQMISIDMMISTFSCGTISYTYDCLGA